MNVNEADKTKGIYRKFNVERVDGSSGPGRKHEHCRYYVLDLDHDSHAPAAIRAYADSCRADYPALAADMDAIYGEGESSPAPDGAKLWIVMKWIPNGFPDFQGVFGSVERAIQACRTDLHCVCPATVGIELGQESTEWLGAWYPLRQPRPQNTGRNIR